MKLKQFMDATGLTSGQVRNLCEKGLIPFTRTSGNRRSFSQKSISAYEDLFSSTRKHYYIGNVPKTVSDKGFDILDLIDLNPKDPMTFVELCRELITSKTTKSLSINTSFSPIGVFMATELCLHCLTNKIQFVGISNV